MKFKGTILITDPCYFAKDDDWGDKINYEDYYIDEETGITDYLMEDTGIGDGTWDVMTVKGFKESRIKNFLETAYELDEDEFDSKLIGDSIGQYSADAGISGVFYLEEVLQYNPEFKEELNRLKGKCAVVIENFEGDIEPFFDETDQLHFIGIGQSVSFYTV